MAPLHVLQAENFNILYTLFLRLKELKKSNLQHLNMLVEEELKDPDILAT